MTQVLAHSLPVGTASNVINLFRMMEIKMDPKIIAELVEMGVIILPLDEFITQAQINQALDEEYLLDRQTHAQNKEWTHD